MSDFKPFAHVRLDACSQCGRILAFSSAFKKLGEHRIEVCEWCRTVRVDGKVSAEGIEVGE